MKIAKKAIRFVVFSIACITIIGIYASHLFGQKGTVLKTDADTLQVLSIPSGLEVYFGPDAGQGAATAATEKGYVPLEAKHALISKNFLKGFTPISLHNVKPGKYLMGIAPVIIIDRNFNRGIVDTTLNIRSLVSYMPLSLLMPPLKEDVEGAVIYSVNLDGPGPHRVIIVNTPQNATIDTLSSIYPKESLFNFDEAIFMTEMKQCTAKLFSENESRKIIELLHRGGKVTIQKGDIKFVAQIKLDGICEMSAGNGDAH